MDNQKDKNNLVVASDSNFVFVHKKTERLTTALYMVTNLFLDSEPMKWTLREKSSRLLSFIINFKDISASREEEFLHDTNTRVLEIVSLLEVASASGLISPMNFSIIKGEFVRLSAFLSQNLQGRRIVHHGDLDQKFFHVERTKVPETNPRPLETNPEQEFVLETPKRTNRQNIIIGLLKKKKDLTIHDIAQTISDCSEKTIQRELIVLIQEGIVRKTGERRWSKYSLI